METPPNRRSRPTRVPTPKLSERKKSLFSPQRRSPLREDIETNIMDGLIPLDFETALLVQNCLKTSLRPKVKKFPEAIVSILKDYDSVPLSILNNQDLSLKTRTSPRNGEKKRSSSNLKNALQRPTKEQAISSPKNYDHERLLKTPSPKISSTDELGALFKDTLHLKSAKHTLLDRTNEISSDEVISEDETAMSVELSNNNKRISEKSPTIPNDSPKKKYPKLDTNSSPSGSNAKTDLNSNTQSPSTNKNFITSIENFSIPTKSFYSSQNKTSTPPKIASSYCRVSLPTSSNKSKKKRPKLNNAIRLSSNVSHKIRRPKFKPTPQTIETILQSLSSEKFKALRSNRLYQKKADEVHKLMRTNRNPIEISRPLNIHGEDDSISFSDSEDEHEVHESIAAPHNSQAKPANPSDEDKVNLKPKKFFKSSTGTGSRNAFTITNNLRATINNGRVSILPSTSGRRKLAGSIKSRTNFTTEQAAVKDIIEWLDDDAPISNPSLPTNIEFEPTESLHDIDEEYAEFRKRLPYKTTDPDVIEQQKQLLDFLISYEICTERNFEIFIIDPDNHKKEASEIVDSLITVVPTTNKSATTESCDDDIFSEMSDSVVFNLTDSQEANNFRQRLPYNTTDTVIAEQQKTLLEFLIKNQICNEENFQIFIADPENHRDRASKILQNYMIGSKDNRKEATILQKIQAENCMSIDPFSVAAEIPSLNVVDSAFESSHSSFVSMVSDDDIGDDIDDDNPQWNRELSPTIPLQFAADKEDIIENAENKSNNPDEGNFYPIFNRAKFRPIIQKSTRKKPSNAILLGGFGANQYQIDAGQKAFGAKQCIKCGLVYTAHEPEEEKLHAIFHRSISILKYKGWIDEDIVSSVPEWGSGGRILRITNNTNSKRLERIIDILNIVDKELGIVSDMIPTPFVAYFAVKSNEIVGFCLVQPLKHASRYVSVDGIDCCTEETFDVRCGISRIWVSPLNRGSKIATKLIEAVRLHTIMGNELSTNEIAFSSPTEDGKLFAQKISKRKDFLVYQSL